MEPSDQKCGMTVEGMGIRIELKSGQCWGNKVWHSLVTTNQKLEVLHSGHYGKNNLVNFASKNWIMVSESVDVKDQS